MTIFANSAIPLEKRIAYSSAALEYANACVQFEAARSALRNALEQPADSREYAERVRAAHTRAYSAEQAQTEAREALSAAGAACATFLL